KFRKSKGKVIFRTVSANTIEIMTPDYMINVDLNNMTAKKVTNPRKFMEEEYEKLSDEEKKNVQKNVQKMGMSGTGMLTSLGGEFKEKAGEHLGYTCDVFSFMGTKIYQMSATHVPLKIETRMMGMNSSQVATRVTENGSIPDAVFAVPEGIKTEYDKDADKMNRSMAKQMIATMKDPEAGEKLDRTIKKTKDDMDEERERQRERQREEDQKEAPDDDRGGDRDDVGEDKPQSVDDAINKGEELFKSIFQ
ncbi:hypothetical protein MNBD_NITROSPINAE02-268, partial [hydrothermal vent metagenome]